MVRNAKQTLHKHMKHAGYSRWFRAFVALVFLASTAVPAFMWIDGMKAYALSPEAEMVIGDANKNLSAKFSFDRQGNRWQFNKDGAAALAANIAKQQGTDDMEGIAGALSQLTAQQVGGSGEKDTSLYSVDLPVKAREGITYYDNVNKLSFKMVPDFGARDGKLVQDRIVYPFADGAQVVYTAQANGLKEDIVLNNYIADTLRYSYNLELPETLQAKLLDDGSIGIYSASPSLFGNISFSNNEDKARVMDARKNGTKDHLVFSIPPPFIKDQTGNAGHTKYLLNGNRITVVADQLKNLKYPLAVDPSVTVTSSSDFALNANNEGGGSIDTANQLTRGGLTGGGVGSWTSQTAVPSSGAGACGGYAQSYGVHNGYIYAVCNTTTTYARLNSNGTINGSWQTGTAPPNVNVAKVGTVYNGYMYITGGSDGVNARFDTFYIKLNADGTMGASWVSGPLMNTRHSLHQVVAYNGYLYVSGGSPSTASVTDKVEVAEIRADGSLGSWAYTTDLTTSRNTHLMRAYNGYMYVTGGNLGGAEAVQYAAINSDGTLGSWVSTTSIPTGANNPYRQAGTGIHNGYWYIVSGCDGSCTATSGQRVIFGEILANGQIGQWQQTTSLPTDQHSFPQFAIYNNYMFSIGGGNDSVYSAPISGAGSVSAFSGVSEFQTSNFRAGHVSVAAGGYLYVMGGISFNGVATSLTNTVRYAPICDGIMTTGGCSAGAANAGMIGTWSDGTAFATARSFSGITSWGNNIYLVGGGIGGAPASGNCMSGTGNSYCTDVQRATINTSTGALTWSGTYTYSSTGREGIGAVVNGNYIYAYGGRYSNDSADNTEVNVAQINPDGTLGGFSSTLAMDTGVSYFGAASWGNNIYAIGGGGSSHLSQRGIVNPATGAITDWTSTGGAIANFSGSAPLTKFGFAANKGTLYISGGQNGLNARSENQIAQINADGTIGNWTTVSQTLANNRSSVASAVYNDTLYTSGGCTTNNCAAATWFRNFQSARINNGGSGSTGSWDTSSAGFSTARFGHGSFAYNGYMYILGGHTGSSGLDGAAYEITYAPIRSDGTIGSGSWIDMPNTPSSVFKGQWIAQGGYVYMIGGKDATQEPRANTEYAAVCTGTNTTVQFGSNQSITDSGDCIVGSSPGSFSAWRTGPSLNTPRSEFGAIAYGGYVYAFAGCMDSRIDTYCEDPVATVEVAQIDSVTGALGAWSTLGGAYNVPTARFNHQVVGYNGYVYVLGGCANIPALQSACDQDLNDVRMAKLNGSGLANDAGCGNVWCAQSMFVDARMQFGAEAYNGYLYVTGGAESPFNDIQYAPIFSNGSIGSWVRGSVNFTTARKEFSTAVYKGSLYILGGQNQASTTRYSDVQFTSLRTIPRIGKYSKLLTISPTTDVASVYYNGVLPPGSSVTYRVAPSTGIFGALTEAMQGTGSEPTPLCGLGTIYYVQLMATINDSTTAVFPDANGTAGNVTDMTVYYRLNATPPPNLRMTGGKWFWGESQRPLDTCKQPNA